MNDSDNKPSEAEETSSSQPAQSQPTPPRKQPTPEQDQTPPRQQAPAPMPTYAVKNPGQVLGIISIILPFVGFSLIGIVLGIISRNKSKQVNMPSTVGTVGLIISIVATVFVTLMTVFLVILAVLGMGILEQYRTEMESSQPIDSTQKEQDTSEDSTPYDPAPEDVQNSEDVEYIQ